MIGDVGRVKAEAHVMSLAALRAQVGNAEFAVELHIQREIGAKTLSVRNTDVVLEHIDLRVRLPGMHVGQGAERHLPRQRKNSPADEAVRYVERRDPVNVGAVDRLLARKEHGGEMV